MNKAIALVGAAVILIVLASLYTAQTTNIKETPLRIEEAVVFTNETGAYLRIKLANYKDSPVWIDYVVYDLEEWIVDAVNRQKTETIPTSDIFRIIENEDTLIRVDREFKSGDLVLKLPVDTMNLPLPAWQGKVVINKELYPLDYLGTVEWVKGPVKAGETGSVGVEIKWRIKGGIDVFWAQSHLEMVNELRKLVEEAMMNVDAEDVEGVKRTVVSVLAEYGEKLWQMASAGNITLCYGSTTYSCYPPETVVDTLRDGRLFILLTAYVWWTEPRAEIKGAFNAEYQVYYEYKVTVLVNQTGYNVYEESFDSKERVVIYNIPEIAHPGIVVVYRIEGHPYGTKAGVGATIKIQGLPANLLWPEGGS